MDNDNVTGDAVRRLARALRQRLEVDRLFGWDVPLSRRALRPPPSPRDASSIIAEEAAAAAPAGRRSPPAPDVVPSVPRTSRPAPVSVSGPAAAGADVDDREALLEPIRGRVAACTSCPLHAGRTNTVFGVGDPRARLLFVGEGPGYDEDQRGEPFVGKAGMLLDRMIQAMGFEREQVYIANVVKCRPPGNRAPEPEEIGACRGYLEEQIAIVKPEVIVALGATAAHALLGGAASLGRMRARFHDFRGIPVMPTYHPAYLLRYPDEKRKVWDDLQQVMSRLGAR